MSDGQPRAERFLREFCELGKMLGAEVVFGAHGPAAEALCCALDSNYVVAVEGQIVEEMLDPVLDTCNGDYILRLDDDELPSAGMVQWLSEGWFLEHDSWFFARYHLWPDDRHVLVESPFFPDFQQRLTTKEKSKRGPELHAGSPFPAYRAPVYMEHHAFLVKTKEERRALTAKYHSIKTGVYMDPALVDVVWPEDAPPKRLRIEPISEYLIEKARVQTWWNQHVESKT